MNLGLNKLRIRFPLINVFEMINIHILTLIII